MAWYSEYIQYAWPCRSDTRNHRYIVSLYIEYREHVHNKQHTDLLNRPGTTETAKFELSGDFK